MVPILSWIEPSALASSPVRRTRRSVAWLKARLRRVNRFAASTVFTALTVFGACHLPNETDPATVGIILLMSVLMSAAFFGMWPGLAAALLAGLALDYFFIPPFYSFNIEDWRNGFSWLIFGLSSIAVCVLAESLREGARTVRRKAIVTQRLAELSRHLSEAGNISKIAETAAASIGASLGAKTIFLLPADGDYEVAASHPRGARLDPAELAQIGARKAFRSIGDRTQSDQQTFTLLPLAPHLKQKALLFIGPSSRRHWQLPDRGRTLDLFAGQVASALQRVVFSTEAREAREAAETERLRSAILTSISHDLKSPLSIILGSASGLLALESGIGTEEEKQLLNSIVEEGQRLDQFISNLLDMSKVESEAIRPRRQPVDLAEVSGSAVERTSRLLSEHRIVTDIPEDLPVLELDPVLMERVLFNLLDNAAKYTPTGTTVTLSAHQEGDFVCLRIADEGGGLRKDQLAHLFQRFHRLEAYQGKPPGTGLGLAICRGFLHAMGSSISVSNRKDRKGLVFTIKLPRRSREAPLKRPKAATLALGL